MKILISFVWLAISIASIPSVKAEFYLNYFDGESVQATASLHAMAVRVIKEQEFLDEFTLSMEKNPTPSTAEFMQFLDVRAKACCERVSKYQSCLFSMRRHQINILRYRNQIDNLFYLIVDDHIRNAKPTLKDLKDYLHTLRSVYQQRIATLGDDGKKFHDTNFLNTRIMSRNISGYKGILVRQGLYLKYNSFQIKHLAHILKKTMTVMNSPEAYIFVDMGEGEFEDIRLDLSYSEKYRLGVKLLSQQLAKLQFDSRFGQRPQWIDVLAAGIDTGIISVELLQQMYNMPAFKDSYRNRYKIYGEVLKGMGKLLLVNTPVVGQISLIPIMILETKNRMEQTRQDMADETHIF